MPDRKTHLSIDRMLLGKQYNRVHALKDAPSQWLGPSHRKLLHDPVSDLLVAMATYPNDPLGAYASALFHDAADMADTARKRRMRRK